MKSKFLLHFAAVITIASPVFLSAQNTVNDNNSSAEPAVTAEVTTNVDGTVGVGAVRGTTSAQPAKDDKPLFDRWLDLTTLTHSERFRNQYGDDGYHYFENGQQRSIAAGKFKFDKNANYTIGFRASTGRTFNWAYGDYAGKGFAARLNDPAYQNDITDPSGDPAVLAAYYSDPAGYAYITNLDSAGWEFTLRELYFSAKPVNHVTIEFGSFNIEKGYSTEITSFDEDGYIAGERVRIEDKKHLFFDQITATSAYLGDFNHPNIIDRGGNFTKSNYRQIAARKQLNPRVGISAEYNWISLNTRTNTFREAIVVDVKESRFLDKVRLEGYERLDTQLQGENDSARQGFALVGEKKIGRLSGDFGLASIDRDYGIYTGSRFAQESGFSLNGDTYNTGIRIFSHVNYKLTSAVTAFGFYTRITGESFTNLNTQGLNAGLQFNLKALIDSKKKVL